MKIIILVLAVVTAGVWMVCQPPDPSTMPSLDPNECWGPRELKDTSIRPFNVTFTQEMIKDLRSRLSNTRLPPPPLEGVGFQYGFNSEQLPPWLRYWREQYPFAEREQLLNQLPQFKTSIQGLDIHFIRVKPQVPSGVKVYPLLIQHGWPGSVREFYELIPLLTQQRPGYDFVFEVIAPSLPGFGFSDAAVRPGLGAAQIAVVLRNLMHRLGHKQFYYQGGDWGSLVGTALVTLYPDDVLGFHTNMPIVLNIRAAALTLIGSVFPSLIVEPSFAERIYPLSDVFQNLVLESGYYHIKATKPDTVGVGMTDSPAGLLAYILEKFSTGTRREFRDRPDGGLGEYFSKDQLIDNLMLYWVSGSFTTAGRIYAESSRKTHRALGLDGYQTPVPTWALQVLNEILYQPPVILRTKFTNLVNVTVLQDGGHFIALEKPEILAADVFKAVKAFREWHIVNKKTEF